MKSLLVIAVILQEIGLRILFDIFWYILLFMEPDNIRHQGSFSIIAIDWHYAIVLPIWVF